MPATPVKVTESKFSKLKFAFLYILIGGLVVSAIISVVALLIGDFNASIQKALFTTFIFVSHSLLALAIVTADRFDRLGKSLVPTVILGVVIANMVTSSLGTWEVWGGEYSWRSVVFYMLLVGTAFIVSGAMKLRLAHRASQVSTHVTVGLVILLAVILTPWIFEPTANFINDFYFRLIGAVSILAGTAFILNLIFNRIVVARNAALAKTGPKSQPMSAGMLAVVITFGSVAALFWSIGLFVLIGSAVDKHYQDHPRPVPVIDNRYR